MSLPESFEKQMREFLMMPTPLTGRSVWIEHPRIKCYVRNVESYYVLDDYTGRLPTIVVSNIEVPVALRGRGYYRSLLSLFLEVSEATNKVCYIENVGDKQHYLIYERRGFSMVPLSNSCEFLDVPRSFYKLPEGIIDAKKESTKAECGTTSVSG